VSEPEDWCIFYLVEDEDDAVYEQVEDCSSSYLFDDEGGIDAVGD
jgi:hypothetical protein